MQAGNHRDGLLGGNLIGYNEAACMRPIKAPFVSGLLGNAQITIVPRLQRKARIMRLPQKIMRAGAFGDTKGSPKGGLID
jgi:hypothetical protein